MLTFSCESFRHRLGIALTITALMFVAAGPARGADDNLTCDCQGQPMSGPLPAGNIPPSVNRIELPGQSDPNIVGAIIRGTLAGPAEFRNVGLVRIRSSAFSGQALCTGTLIAPNWVLTAAHCVTNENTGAYLPDMTISVEFSTGDTSAAILAVKHPTYAGFVANPLTGSVVGDICLLKLQTSLDNIPTADIQTSAPYVRQPLTLVGYGNYGGPIIGQQSGTAGIKRFGSQRIDSVTTEQVRWYFGFPELQSTAQGDSGGPQFNSNLAVVSVTSGLSRNSLTTPIGAWRTTSFNTRADKYFNWITQTIVENLSGSEQAPNPSRNFMAQLLTALKAHPLLAPLLLQVSVTQSVD